MGIFTIDEDEIEKEPPSHQDKPPEEIFHLYGNAYTVHKVRNIWWFFGGLLGVVFPPVGVPLLAWMFYLSIRVDGDEWYHNPSLEDLSGDFESVDGAEDEGEGEPDSGTHSRDDRSEPRFAS
jgi:hypothetical protein